MKKSKFTRLGIFRQYFAQIIFLFILFFLLSLTTNTFLTSRNLINVLRQCAPNMYVSLAMTMILIVSGIDLSIGSVMATVGMISAYMSLAGLPFWICALTGIAAGGIVGFVNGTIISNTDVPPFIVSYSTQLILRGMVYVITTAGTLRISDKVFASFGGGSLGFLPWPIFYMIVVIIIAYLILNKMKIGRHMYAIGGNKKAAIFAGINTKKVLIFVYSFSGVMAALAGLVYTSRNNSMQPTLGIGLEMDAIAAAVLGGASMMGGQGSVFGTVLGVFIIGFINNGLNLLRMDSFWQYFCKGIVILFAVYMDSVKNKRLLSKVNN